jgi:hypothetical protein
MVCHDLSAHAMQAMSDLYVAVMRLKDALMRHEAHQPRAHATARAASPPSAFLPMQAPTVSVCADRGDGGGLGASSNPFPGLSGTTITVTWQPPQLSLQVRMSPGRYKTNLHST